MAPPALLSLAVVFMNAALDGHAAGQDVFGRGLGGLGSFFIKRINDGVVEQATEPTDTPWQCYVPLAPC